MIVIVAVIGIVVAFLYRSAEFPLLPEGTPEGTVHRFLSAIESGDTVRGYDYLSPSLKETCNFQHFRDSVRWFDARDGRNSGDLRVTLDEVRPINGAVEVRVRIIRFSFSSPSPLAPPFESGESSYGESFTLERFGDEWLFIDPPWPMSRCPESKEEPPPVTPLRPAPG